MAIYHFSIKNIGRSNGRSAVAAAAYRSGEKLVDSVYGKEQDYTKKTGIEYKNIYVPSHANENLLDRQTLWNEVEKSELKKNGDLKTTARLAKEFEIAFPQEVNADTRKRMLDELAQTLVKNHNVIVDAVIHAPHTKSGSDERNYHAHIMFTTRSINEQGELGKKAREFNDNGKNLTIAYRELWANMVNRELEQLGIQERVSHLSYSDLKYDLEPTVHEGSKVTQLRRQGIDTEISLKNDAIKARNAEKLANEQLIKGLDQEIILADKILSDLESLKRPQRELEQSGQANVHIEPKNALERKIEPFNSILDHLQKDLEHAHAEKAVLIAEIEKIQQTLQDMETNKPKEKFLGLITTSEFLHWKEDYLKLKSTLDTQKNKLSVATSNIWKVERKIEKESEKSKSFDEKTENKLDFNTLYQSLNHDQKQAYNALKTQLEQRFNNPHLEQKLAQVQDKFIEKYQENPNFEMPKPELQRPQQQDFVRGAIKDDQDKGR